MKVAKLSLAAVVVVAAGFVSNAFAADTLLDAFKNGKVSGELRAYYFDRDTGVANPAIYTTGSIGKGDSSIFNTGIVLGYITDSLYGFKLGATFQSNYAPFASDDAKNVFAGSDMYGSGAVLSEAYINYKIGKTDIKIGRQFIGAPISPLVWNSGSRMIKESFEGATVINKDLPDTTLMAGYITKFQARTTTAIDGYNIGTKTVLGSDSKIPDFEKIIFITKGAGSAVKQSSGRYAKSGSTFSFDGAYTASIINTSIPSLTLTGQYLQINDIANIADASVYYTEANYLLPVGNLKWAFDVMFRGSTTDDALDAYNLEGTYIGVRTGIKEWNGLGATIAYGQTSKDDAVLGGMGNGIYTYTTTLIRGPGNSLDKNSKGWLFELTYDFEKVGVKGLSFLGIYCVANLNDNEKISSTGKAVSLVDIDYTTKTAALYYEIPNVKGLKIGIEYETQEKDDGKSKVDTDEYRLRAQYKF